MADDPHLGLAHGAEQCIRVLLARTRPDAGIMQARDCIVETREQVLLEVYGARKIHDVELGTHDDIDAIGLGADDLEVAEIELMESAGHGRCMVGNADKLQAFFFSGSNHLAQGAVGMDTRNGMCMYVQ